MFTPGDFEVLLSVSKIMQRTPSDAIRQMVNEKAVSILNNIQIGDIYSKDKMLIDATEEVSNGF
jgi:hypothetical protein